MDMQTLRKMTDEQLRALNADVVAVIRERSVRRQQAAARQFNVGDVAQFYSTRQFRSVQIIIDRINTKSVSGREMENGRATMRTWRVAPTLLKPVA